MAEPDTHRLIFLFFEPRKRDSAMYALEAFLKPRTPISAPAMNTATKRPCGPATPPASPRGRLALEFSESAIDWQRG